MISFLHASTMLLLRRPPC